MLYRTVQCKNCSAQTSNPSRRCPNCDSGFAASSGASASAKATWAEPTAGTRPGASSQDTYWLLATVRQAEHQGNVLQTPCPRCGGNKPWHDHVCQLCNEDAAKKRTVRWVSQGSRDPAQGVLTVQTRKVCGLCGGEITLFQSVCSDCSSKQLRFAEQLNRLEALCSARNDRHVTVARKEGDDGHRKLPATDTEAEPLSESITLAEACRQPLAGSGEVCVELDVPRISLRCRVVTIVILALLLIFAVAYVPRLMRTYVLPLETEPAPPSQTHIIDPDDAWSRLGS